MIQIAGGDSYDSHGDNNGEHDDIEPPLDHGVEQNGGDDEISPSASSEGDDKKELTPAEIKKVQADKVSAVFKKIKKEYNLVFPKDDPMVRAIVIIVQMLVVADKRVLRELRDEYKDLTSQLKTATDDFKVDFITVAKEIIENNWKQIGKYNDDLVNDFVDTASKRLDGIVNVATAQFDGKMEHWIVEIQKILNQVQKLELAKTSERFARVSLYIKLIAGMQGLVMIGMLILLLLP